MAKKDKKQKEPFRIDYDQELYEKPIIMTDQVVRSGGMGKMEFKQPDGSIQKKGFYGANLTRYVKDRLIGLDTGLDIIILPKKKKS